MKKRVIAFLLVVIMLVTSVGDMLPYRGYYTSAEGEESIETAPEENVTAEVAETSAEVDEETGEAAEATVEAAEATVEAEEATVEAEEATMEVDEATGEAAEATGEAVETAAEAAETIAEVAETTTEDETPEPGETIVEDEKTVDDETSKEDETSSEDEKPAEDATPSTEVTPEEEVTPAAEVTPEDEGTPEAEVTPEDEVTSAAEETPEDEGTPEAEVTPEDEGTPAAEVTPEDEVTPAAEETPEDEVTPAAEETPEDEVTPAAEVTPEDEGTPKAEETPENEATPAAEEIPSGEESDTEEPEQALILLTTEAEESTDAPAAAAEGIKRTAEARMGDRVIVVTGEFPEDITVQVAEIPKDKAVQITGKEPLFAYDIRLVTADGKVWQPGDYGKNVSVSVRDLNGETYENNIEIFHIKTDLMDADGNLSEATLDETIQNLNQGDADTEFIDAEQGKDGEIQFNTTSFSPLLANALTALEQLIQNTLEEIGDTLSGTHRIILDNNTTYSGDSVLISAKGKSVADNFKLELVASDAGENGMKGNGQTVIDSNVIIDGIKVLMQSIVIAAGKTVTVQNAREDPNRGGSLEYKGIESLATELNVNVGKISSLDVTTAGKDDKITVTAESGANHVNINAGDGLNKILATVSGGDLNIQTGQDQDDVEVRILGTANNAEGTSQIGNVIVDTGAGNDTLYVLNNGQSKNEPSQKKVTVSEELTKEDGTKYTSSYQEDELKGIVISAGSGDDTITLDVRANAGNMILNTGAGGDVVDVRKGDLNTAETLDYNHVFNPYEEVNKNASTKVTINNGSLSSDGKDARDFVTIDVSVARAIREIELKGGKGASVHLKGTLATLNGSTPIKEEDRIKWKDANKKTIVVQSSTVLSPEQANQLEITAAAEGDASYSFTDKLDNKKQKSLYIQDGATEYTASLALEDFTDYVFKSSIANVNRISIQNTGSNSSPFLSNLVFDIEETHDDNDTLTIQNIYNGTEANKTAIPLNVLVKAPTIEFNGTVKARNVRAESVQGSREFDYVASISRSLDDTIDNAINLYDCAEIIVNKGAVIETEQDTALMARVKHFGGTLALAWMLNIANIKVATATVQIDGEIRAGGSVTADAIIETQQGNKIIDVEGEAGNPAGVFLTDGDAVPVGIKFVMNDASVNVGMDAKVIAQEDVLLRSRSDVTVYNYENGNLPFAVAATYINNDVQTLVEGEVQAGRSVLVQADGRVVSDTQANHRSDTKDSSVNVFVGLNVVDQNVDAVIRGGKVTAQKGDVAVYATAIADVKTIASASSMMKEMTSTLPEALNPVGLLVSGLKGLTYPFVAGFKAIRGKTRKADYYTKKLEKMVNKVSAGTYDVSVVGFSEENDQKGTATVKVKVSKFTAGDNDHAEGEVPEGQEGGVEGLFAVVDVQPKAGYSVKKVRYRYLESGKEHFTYVTVLPNAQGEYIFALKYPNTPYEVIVEYQEGQAQAANNVNEDEAVERASINLDDLEDGYDINGLLEEAALGSADNAEEAEQNGQKTSKDYVFNKDPGENGVKIEINQPRGADSMSTGDYIVLWQAELKPADTGIQKLNKVYAGQEIRFIGNPTDNTKELKKLTITYYTDGDVHTGIKNETVLTPDSKGRFVFTVPENITANKKIEITGEFGPKDNGNGPAHNQMTGSLGFSYVNNQGNARIEAGEREEVVESEDVSYQLPLLQEPVTVTETLTIGTKKIIRTPEVTAGGTVDMLGIHTTSVETLADGTALTEKPALSVSTDEAKPQETTKVKWTVPGADYAIKVSSNLKGTVDAAVTKDQDGGSNSTSFSHPVFSFKPDTDVPEYSTANLKIQVSYYTKFNMSLSVGKHVTDEYSYRGATVHPDQDTTISTKHTANGMVITVTKGADTKEYTVPSGTEEYSIGDQKITVSADRKTIKVGEGSSAQTFSTKVSEGDITVDSTTGKITFKPSLAKLAVVEGTTMDVNFIFQDAAGNALENGNGTVKYAIANPVNIQFNALKKDKTLAATFTNGNLEEMGTITYHNTIPNDDNTLTYQFAIKAKAGYKLDAKGSHYGEGTNFESNTERLYASWVGADGLTHRQPLQRATGEGANAFGAEVWNFTLNPKFSIPAGATISITAEFEKDERKIEQGEPTVGSAEDLNEIKEKLKPNVSKSAAAEKDKITVKYSLDSDELNEKYAIASVRWHVEGYPDNIHDVSLDGNGQAKFEIPEGTFNGKLGNAGIILVPVILSRSVTLTPAENIKLSEKKKGYIGETVKVTLSKEELAQGKKIDKILVNGVEQTGKDSFTIPNNAGSGEMKITVTTREGTYGIASYTDTEGLGSIEPVCAKADNGDTVQLQIKPKAGYRAQYGSVMATLVTSTQTRRITASWAGDNLYTFDLHLDEGETLTSPIKVEGKFEKGEDGVAMSAGIAAAVGIIQGENRVEIADGVISAGEGLSMFGVSSGNKAVTEAKAGYSAGKTGAAGAVGVQIASAVNKVAIRQDEDWDKPKDNKKTKAEAQAANDKLRALNDPLNFALNYQTYEIYQKDRHSQITIGKTENGKFVPGYLFLKSKNGENFKVTGDAANKKESEAKGTGVGAGVAVAIDSIESIAEIEDNVWLNTNSLSKMTVHAETKVKDKVTARAGAIGGSAFVPSAAVDIYENDVMARVGKLKKAGTASDPDGVDLGELNVAGPVKVFAESTWANLQYNHEVISDASARGGKVAMGGAFAVTWLDTDVRAELNNTVKADGDISVTSTSAEALKAVTVAAVSGGYAGSTADGEGSADKQANNLLGGAANMAGKYAGKDAEGIKAEARGRQKAETAESTTAGAGAMVLNIMKNRSRAEIMNNVDVETTGKLKVVSMNRTEATIRANASTTNSNTGVGVGIALNIVTMDNIARIGNGGIKAGELELRAEIAEAPTYATAVMPTEGKSTFEIQLAKAIEDGLKNLLGDSWGDNMVTDALASAAAAMARKLIDDLNLNKLFTGVGNSAMDTLMGTVDTLVDRVKELPKALISPIWTLAEQTIGTVSGWDSERFGNLFEDIWTTATIQLAGNAMGMTRTMLQESMGAMINSAMNTANRLVNGQGFDVSIVMDKVKSTITNAFDRVVEKTVQDVIKRMSAEIPLMTESNMQLIQDMKDTSFQKIKDSIVPYITQTIRDQVWDYEPVLAKIQEKGFTDYLKSEAKALLKEGVSTMTNEMIDGIVGKMDVKISMEPVADRHVITTQAISGAGAKNTSGAGSLAIAVVNMDTQAEIAASDKTVTVDGDMILNAEELRRVRTHATAAVDARNGGDPVEALPDNNEGIGDSEEDNTGSGNSVAPNSVKSDSDRVIVSYNKGGKVEIDKDVDGYITLTPDEGYRRPTTIKRTWTDAEGNSVSRELTIGSGDESFYVFKGFDSPDDVVKMEVEVLFEEKTYQVAVPSSKDGNLKGSVAVDDREPDEDGAQLARPGEMVRLTFPKTASGQQVDEVTVKYRDEELKEHSYTLKTDPSKFTLISENRNETVYGILMPAGFVSEITFTMAQGQQNAADQEDSWEDLELPDGFEAATMAKDAMGRKVGVGAAFALTYGNSNVTAQIGSRDPENGKSGARGQVTAGTISVTASSEHEEENFSTAGTDPFEGTSSNQQEGAGEKDLGVDASVAINILDNDIYAGIAKGTGVKTTAIPGVNDPERHVKEEKKSLSEKTNDQETANEDTGEDEPKDIEIRNGAVIISATEVSENETKASAFATGSTTAVGASVAVNVSLSEIEAALGAGAAAAGKVDVRSHSLSRDNTWSFASAMGADIQRKLNKAAEMAEKTEETANGLTTGEIFDKKTKTKGNDTGERIAEGLNRNRAEDGQEARGDLAVSDNVMRSQNAQADNAEDAQNAVDGSEALGQVQEKAGKDLTGKIIGQGKSKIQAAATAAVTVSSHKARTNVYGSVTSGEGDISLTSMNAGNFRTRSTAAAMSMAAAFGGGKDIALAFGVSVNNNQAVVDVQGNLVAENGDVTVAADLKQNQTDEYKGYLAVQSVSGAFSGKGYDLAISGALSALVSHAVTKATVKNDSATTANPARITGRIVSVTANDKSKLAIRAGGVNLSTGASKGVGMSSATIWSGNTVTASIGDNTTVEANEFALSAIKQKVTYDDFVWPVGAKNFMTDTSELNDEQRENVYTGLIDVHRKPGEKSYSIDINVDSYALMNFVDELNFLSSQNYYAEAVGGSLITGQAKLGTANALNLTGSFSIVRAENIIDAILGKNVKIVQKQAQAEQTADSAAAPENRVQIVASGDTTARLIGGALSVGSAKNAAGATVTFLYNQDKVNAASGAGLVIEADGAVKQAVSADMEVMSINAAAAVSTEVKDESRALGGSLEVILLQNRAINSIGDNARITGGSVETTASADKDLMTIIVSAMGASRGTAVGGTVAYNDLQTEARIKIGKNQRLEAKSGDLTIRADSVDRVISAAASASVGLDAVGDGGKSFAGTLNIIHARTKALVELAAGGEGHGLFAAGNIEIAGEAETRAVNATLAAAGAKKGGIGLNLNFNFFSRESGVSVKGGDGYRMTAGKDVRMAAEGADLSVLAALALSGAKKSAASGNLPILVTSNEVKNTLGKALITAGGKAEFTSRLEDTTVAVAGQVAVSLSKPGGQDGSATGAGALFAFRNNTVKTEMGTSTVQARGGDILVGAEENDHTYGITAGIAVSTGRNSVNVNAVTSVNSNTVHADAGKAELFAVNNITRPTAGGSVNVKAKADSLIWAVAGGLSLSFGNSVGPGLIVLTASKDVKALGHHLHALQDVNVTADNRDEINELNVNAGATMGMGSGNIQTGISVQVLKNSVNAAVASEVKAVKGSFNLTAKNRSFIDNINIALAGTATSDLTLAPVFALTYYGGETNAMLGSGEVDAAGAVNISADAYKDIDQYTIGAAAGMGMGKYTVSGAVSLMFLKDSTNALVQHGTSISAGSLDVNAQGDYDLTGASAAISYDSSATAIAGAVNTIVTVAKANVLAEMEGKAALDGAANISASAKRDIVDVALNVSGAGTAGVGVTVMSLVAGDRMDKDAADMLAYGSNNKESGQKAFDSDAMVSRLKELGVDTSDLEAREETPDPRDRTRTRQISGITEDLSGNQNASYEVKTQTDGVFDASSGMVNQDDFKDDTTLSGQEREQAKLDQTQGAEHNPENKDENRETKETKDIVNARSVGTTVYSDDPDDAVVARIARDAEITARGVNVTAEQDSTADLFSATIGIGKELGGAGVGFGIAILRSNVIAASLGTVDAQGGNMTVDARSTTGDALKTAKEDTTAAERNSSLMKSFSEGGEATARSIRVVGLAVGGGSQGLGLAGSVARADNITQAILGGKVQNVKDLTVNGASKYENILAVTVAGAGGVSHAIAGSVAVAIADGEVEARIDDSADITGTNSNIYVTTEGMMKARTGAASAAVGMTASGVGTVSVVNNSLTQNTSIDQGASLNIGGEGGNLHVKATSVTSGESMMISAAYSGTIALGLGFSMVNVNPEIHTTIGVNPKTGANARTSLGKMKSVEIDNDVESSANSLLASISASMKAGIAGNVLLVFNDTDAEARIGRAGGEIGSLKVSGNLDAEGEATFAHLGVGFNASIGASVSYVDVNSRNIASINTDEFDGTVTGPVKVVTNDKREGKTSASVTSLSADAAFSPKGGAVSLNAAVARNRAVSAAMINGNNGIGGSSVELKSNGIAEADALLVGLALSAGTGSASVAVALNEATSLSQMRIGGAIGGDLDAAANLDAKTHAKQLTGAIGLAGIAVNVAKAKGTSQALVDIDLGAAPADTARKMAVKSKVTGSNDVESKILNQDLQLAGTIAFMDGVAYSKDVYDNHVTLRGGDYNLKNADVTTDYTSKANAVVNPSALGVDIKLSEMSFDMAEAKGKAYARAQLEIDDATVSSDGDINVKVNGWGSADSGVASANYFALKGVNIGGSLARAELANRQAAVLKLDKGTILDAAAVNVRSMTDNATTGASHGASGTNDEPQDGFEINVGEFTMHYVRAKENIDSTAMIQGTGSENNGITADELTVRSGISRDGKTAATASSKESVEFNVLSIGGLNTEARTGDSFYAQVSGVDADIAGPVTVYAKGNTKATSEATSPADTGIVSLSISHIRAGIGEEEDRQTAMVLIGDDTKLKSEGAMLLYAENNGETNTDFTKNVVDIVGVKYASIPTHSYYDTGVAIGQKVQLDSRNTLDIRSISRPNAVSDLDSLGAGVLVDYSIIRGENNIDSQNNIDIGQQTHVTAEGTVRILAADSTKAEAKAIVRGGGGILGGEVVSSVNNINRNTGITVDNGALIRSDTSNIFVENISGVGDNITSESYVKSGGLFTIGSAYSENKLTSVNTIKIGANARMTAHKDLRMVARATSYASEGDSNLMEPDHPEDNEILAIVGASSEENLSQEEKDKRIAERDAAKAENDAAKDKMYADSDKAEDALDNHSRPEKTNYGTSNTDDSKPFGIYAKGVVKAQGAFVWPNSGVYNTLNFTTYININRNEGTGNTAKAAMTAHTGDIVIRADNQGLRAKTKSEAYGGALYSDIVAKSQITANLQNTIWIDNASLSATNPMKENGERAKVQLLVNNFGTGDRPYLVAIAETGDSGAFASEDPTAIITGTSFNQIKSTNTLSVTFRGDKIHIARNPQNCIDYKIQENGSNKSWAFGAAKRRCDFCYEEENADQDKDSEKGMGQSSYVSDLNWHDLERTLRRHMEKALAPLTDIQRQVDQIIGTVRARYGEEDYAAAGKIFVLEYPVVLTKDVTLDNEQINKYRLWNNTATYLDVYLLPNATRLYGNRRAGKIMLQYVAEVLRGEVRGDGEIHDIDIITALTKRAFSNPVMPVGSTGSLNFATGMLTLPSLADFELYLHEVSANWLLGKIDEGFIRGMIADPDAANGAAMNGEELPEGSIAEGLVPDGEADGWKKYWLGDTPETAEDPDQILIYLLVNEETDEVDAFRTSVNMIEGGEEPVDVSLYLYRDSQSDRAEIEKYNCMFFDTPEGEKSLVKVVTNVVGKNELDMPVPLRIVLRGFHLEGADLPVYSLTDHFFAMCDGTDGEVSMFDGFYTNTFDGDTFDSDYIRIEGIADGDLNVTVKEGQAIWPEWTGENTAEDIAGNRYEQVEGEWYPEEDAPTEPLPEDAVAV